MKIFHFKMYTCCGVIISYIYVVLFTVSYQNPAGYTVHKYCIVTTTNLHCEMMHMCVTFKLFGLVFFFFLFLSSPVQQSRYYNFHVCSSWNSLFFISNSPFLSFTLYFFHCFPSTSCFYLLQCTDFKYLSLLFLPILQKKIVFLKLLISFLKVVFIFLLRI